MMEKTLKIPARFLIVFFLVAFLWACAPRQLLVDEMAGIVGAGVTAFEADDDLDLLEKAIPANIKLLETLLESSRDNPDLLVLLSRLYGSYAFVFFEGKLERAELVGEEATSGAGEQSTSSLRAAVSRYYLKGMDYALSAIEARHGLHRDDLKKIATRDLFFEKLTPKDVPALFWYGFSLGLYVNVNLQNVKAMSQASLVGKSMQRVVALDPGYYHGCAHLFLFAYYASRPPMLGGNLEKALGHYRQLKKIAGDDFLMSDLFYARYYLPRIQDIEAYESLLARIRQPVSSRKAYRLYNKVAAERAKIYLEAKDQLFE